MCSIQPYHKTVSRLALSVALRTMKERCLALQQRVSAIEEENKFLRSRLETNGHKEPDILSLQNTQHSTELDNLRFHVSELNSQKVQLTNDINMVANENKKLWSRLSEIAKDQAISNKYGNENDSVEHKMDTDMVALKSSSFILSPTFTLYAPTNLKFSEENGKEDHNLENGLFYDTTASEDAYNTRKLHSDDMTASFEEDNGVSCFNVHVPDDDFNIEAKKCLQGLHKIRLQAIEQQHGIASAVATLQKRFVLQGCSICTSSNKKADKSCNTEYMPDRLSHYIGQRDDTAQDLPNDDFMRRKLEADKRIKVCPMCGLIYGTTLSFDSFCKHVESHFYEDATPDPPGFE